MKISGEEFGNPYIGTCQSHGVHMFQKELTLSLQRSTGNEMCTRKNKHEDDMAIITSISRPLQKENGDVNIDCRSKKHHSFIEKMGPSVVMPSPSLEIMMPFLGKKLYPWEPSPGQI